MDGKHPISGLKSTFGTPKTKRKSQKKNDDGKSDSIHLSKNLCKCTKNGNIIKHVIIGV